MDRWKFHAGGGLFKPGRPDWDGRVLLWTAPVEALTPDVADSGWMDQYGLDSSHNFVSNEACVPTSSTNALTCLQNAFPTLYGMSLSGTTYSDGVGTLKRCGVRTSGSPLPQTETVAEAFERSIE